MFRYDDFSREERYFSATILPALLVFNNFSGLQKLEEFLYENGILNRQSLLDESVQVLSEPYLERDLPKYNISIPEKSFAKKLKKQVKPDLLIMTNTVMYLWECKFFNNESEYSLHSQILGQKYIFDIVNNTCGCVIEEKIHLLVLPYKYDIPDCHVITWNELYSTFAKVIPERYYFLERLKKGIERL